jgi:ABC-2 type transport system ATP-binding protein
VKVIEVMGISKRFGSTVALDRVSFEAEQGDTLALVGPNGAGKTTLLRILATLGKPDGGYAKILGLDGRFQAARIRSVLGYMPDAFGMYEDLSVQEYLEFFAGLYGISGSGKKATIDDLIDLLDMREWKDRSTGDLSRGMQQRVGLARTLIHDPQVLLLDEPAANLDPGSRIEIREVLKELRRMGKTILVSSHILRELEDLCDQVVCIDRGRVLHWGSIADLASRIRPHREVLLRIGEDSGRFRATLASEPGVEAVLQEEGLLRIRLRIGVEDYSFIPRRAVECDVPVLELREDEPGLEEVFVRLTGGMEES